MFASRIWVEVDGPHTSHVRAQTSLSFISSIMPGTALFPSLSYVNFMLFVIGFLFYSVHYGLSYVPFSPTAVLYYAEIKGTTIY